MASPRNPCATSSTARMKRRALGCARRVVQRSFTVSLRPPWTREERSTHFPARSLGGLGGGSRRRLGVRFRRLLRPLRGVAALILAPAAVAPPAAALLLQLGSAPLGVQVVLLDVVLRLGPHGDALVELHHQEPHRLPLRALQELRHVGMAGDHQLVLAVLARAPLVPTERPEVRGVVSSASVWSMVM